MIMNINTIKFKFLDGINKYHKFLKEFRTRENMNYKNKWNMIYFKFLS